MKFELLKNVTMYKAALPSCQALNEHLEERLFVDITESQYLTAGFVSNEVTGELVTPFDGGYAFTLRVDEKLLPPAVIRSEVKRRIAASEEKVTAKDRKLIRDQVFAEFVQKALVKTQVVNAFYHTESGLLFVDTISKTLAGMLMSDLIKACASVKTETIHISDVKLGITTKLKEFYNGKSDAFGGFDVGCKCQIKQKNESMTLELEDLGMVAKYLDQGFCVEKLELLHGDISFNLSSDFKLRAIKHELIEHDEVADVPYIWRSEAAIHTLTVVAIVNKLCQLLEYKDETKAA